MGSSVILPMTGQPATGPDPSFQSQTLKRAISFARENLSPPSPLYVTAENKLLISCQNSAVGGQLKVSPRILFPDGTISYGESIFIPTSDRTINTFEIPLQEGFLLSVHVANGGVVARRGQLYARVNIEYGSVGFGAFVQPLVADYIVSTGHTGWPGGRVIQSVEGPGFIHSIQQANPAAGADWTFTCPTSSRMLVHNFNAQLAIANAGVARIVRVQIKDGAGNLLVQAAAQQTGAINTTVQVSGMPGQVTSVIDTTTLNLALPGVPLLLAGHTIQVSTSNINAADQWSAIWLDMEEWIEL